MNKVVYNDEKLKITSDIIGAKDKQDNNDYHTIIENKAGNNNT